MLKKSTFTEFLQIIEKKTFYYFFLFLIDSDNKHEVISKPLHWI